MLNDGNKRNNKIQNKTTVLRMTEEFK